MIEVLAAALPPIVAVILGLYVADLRRRVRVLEYRDRQRHAERFYRG